MPRFLIAGSARAVMAAGLALCFVSAAHAYTAEQQQACTDDAFRLCGSFIPDVDRVTACMAKRKAQLSPACKAQFGPAPRARSAATSTRVKTSKSTRRR